MSIRKVLQDSEYQVNVPLWEVFSVTVERQAVWNDTIGAYDWKTFYKVFFKGWVTAGAANNGATELQTITVNVDGDIGEPGFPISQEMWDNFRETAYQVIAAAYPNFALGAPGLGGAPVEWVYD
jgi:hypothetical protein